MVDPLHKYKEGFRDKRVPTQIRGDKYKTIPVIEDYRAYDRRKWVKYFTDAERFEREVIIKDGTFIRKKTGKNIPMKLDKNGQTNFYVFVMDGKGRLFFQDPDKDEYVGKFHHSSFLAAKPVAMAGTIFINPDGKIEALTTQSGHYRPVPGMVDQVIDEFKKNGVTYNFWVMDFGGTRKYHPIEPPRPNVPWWICCKK
jgi:hypothetical protein